MSEMKAREVIADCLALNAPENGLDQQWLSGLTDSILSALDKAGMQVVPKEPTETMHQAGTFAWMNRNLSDPKSEPIRDCYKAMISAHAKEEAW